MVQLFMAMNIEAKIRDLKRRVSELEGSFGVLTQQIKAVHKDLLAFLARAVQRFANIDGRLDKTDGRLDRLEMPRHPPKSPFHSTSW